MNRTALFQSLVFRVVLVLFTLTVLLEICVQVWEVSTGAPNTIYDIQTPAHLITRMESFARHPGPKIAVVGDSIVYGASMGEHGDSDWQSHTISAQLRQRLIGLAGPTSLRVENFGLNGALPTEIERLVTAILTTGPDAVIFDVGIRSFSEDFEGPGKRASRPWLETFRRSAGGDYWWRPPGKTTAARFDHAVDSSLLRFWHTYRWRETLQAIWFKGKPTDLARRTRDELDQWFLRMSHTGNAVENGEEERLLEMLKIKKRYKTIAFSLDRDQTKSLIRTLDTLEKSGVPTIVFYATENPSMIKRVISKRKYGVARQSLNNLLKPFLRENGRTVMVDQLDNLDAERFLDLVHVDAKGYAQYAEALRWALCKLAARPSMEGTSLRSNIPSLSGAACRRAVVTPEQTVDY